MPLTKPASTAKAVSQTWEGSVAFACAEGVGEVVGESVGVTVSVGGGVCESEGGALVEGVCVAVGEHAT